MGSLSASLPLPSSAELQTLQQLLKDVRFPIALPGWERDCENARSLVSQVEDYLLPRLIHADAPLLAVVGGSTGAGKSTLINSLLGSSILPAGALRPTTRQPSLVSAPANMPWFLEGPVLPGLARTQNVGSGVGTQLAIAEDPQVPAGLALLDAPDFDSVDQQNRELSKQLLAAADLWIFVTTAARYADLAAWQVLERAAKRNVQMVVVLNRVPPGAAEEIKTDLAAMLAEKGLYSPPLFTISEASLKEGLISSTQMHPLRNFLEELGNDQQARRDIAQKSLAGALTQLQVDARALADQRERQQQIITGWHDIIDDCYSAATESAIREAATVGALREEVLSRWQDYVGTSDIFRTVETWFGGARDTVSGWLRGKPANRGTTNLQQEITGALAASIQDQAYLTSRQLWERLRTTPAGRQTFSHESLRQPSNGSAEESASLVRHWQADLLELVSQTSPKKRQRARVLSLGVNGVTVALMLVVFASTGGLMGGEVAIAGGSALVGQKVLETIFGDQAVRQLSNQGKVLLEDRIQAFFQKEADRYHSILAEIEGGTAAQQLRDAVDWAGR